MEKVRPWCGQPSDRGRLKNRTVVTTVVVTAVCCVQTMTDVAGNPEEERRANFYYQPWAQEAVCRYFYGKVRS